ncbi:hypothetical protein NDU88_006172 [Pleurodeles waltl]|uniref:Uncharacterized protein n=1 Tax=Pleurodeles waltl TaxID=8319 RepID=A0AAV7LU28_PLEWA|nr:hypothetical protein NDU88_006172 [Pleurodeles waltl]
MRLSPRTVLLCQRAGEQRRAPKAKGGRIVVCRGTGAGRRRGPVLRKAKDAGEQWRMQGSRLDRRAVLTGVEDTGKMCL